MAGGKYVNEVEINVHGLPCDVHVTGFELFAAVGAVPSLRLEVLPQQVSGKTGVSASSPALEDLTSMFRQLSNAAELRFSGIGYETRADVSIGITRYPSSGGDGDVQEQHIDLEEWVLTDAALTSVTVSAAPRLFITLKHRIEVLSRTGAIYESPVTMNPMSVVCSKLKEKYAKSIPNGMVEILDDVYRLFADGKNVLYYEPFAGYSDEAKASAKKVSEFRKNITKAPISDFLEGTSGLFLNKGSDVSGYLKYRIAVALAEIAAHGFHDSVWDTLVRSYCPACLLQVVPSYHMDKLLLSPCEPWADPAYELDGSIIESVDMSSQDTDPLCGIAMQGIALSEKSGPDKSVDPSGSGSSGAKQMSYDSIFYIPPNASCGRILQVGTNPVVAAAEAANMTKANGSDVSIGRIQNTAGLKEFVGLCSGAAHGMFSCLWRESCRASVGTVMTFEDSKGDTIYPGNVVDVKIGSGSSAKTVVRGYLSAMVVSGSTHGNCTTTFEFTHARPVDMGTALVPEGTKNPCYGS